MRLLKALRITVLCVLGIGFVSFVSFVVLVMTAFECTHYPVEIENPIYGEYMIVGRRQACPTTRADNQFYLKRKNDDSDGYVRRNLIVVTKPGFRVDVKWVEPNIIEVTSYSDESIRKIKASVKGIEVRHKKEH